MLMRRRTILLGLFIYFGLSMATAQSGSEIVSGKVRDELGPLVMVNVIELDEANRVVSHDVTDINGNFSIRIKSPRNKLRFSYVGYETLTVPIDRKVFDIVMADAMVLQAAEITGRKAITQTGGLSIPERELSMALQSIDMSEFEGLSFTSIDEALQGRIAGLDIVVNSGNLGSGSSMRLRGVSSINANSEPLIVVDDNVQAVDQTDFDVATANEERFAQLLNINVEDIESVTVLKDAAATAIWGSQGANGVILIKTRRGAKGPARLTYSYKFSGTHQPKGLNMLTGDQYTMMLKEAYFNPTLSDAAANIIELNYDPTFSEYQQYNNNTDWREQVIKFGQKHSHYLSLSGGGDKANFRVSGGYDGETGTIIAQKLDRFSTRVALDYFVSERIKIMSNFALTYTNNQRNSDALLNLAYRKMPNLTVFEQDIMGNDTHEYYQVLQSCSNELSDQRNLVNPVASAYLAKNLDRNYSIVPEIILNYNLLGLNPDENQLRYEGRILLNISNAYNDSFYPRELTTTIWSSSAVNRAIASSNKSLTLTHRHSFMFTPVFSNTDHSVMSLLRAEVTDGNSGSQSTTTYGLPSAGIESASAEGMLSGISSGAGQWRSIYYTFSAHYSYKSKYMADFSLRRDGTTKFGPSKRWGYFPAFSLRWNISDEPWMRSLEWLSMLSLRPGWGVVGNQPGAEYLYVSRYTTADTYIDMPAIIPSNIRLANLQWETKTTWNLGLDFGFWNNKLTGDVNIYDQYTSDLLMSSVAIPTSSGYAALSWQNVGSMRNNGWELNFQGNQLVELGKLKLGFNLSFANNKNIITEMDERVLESLNSDFSRSNGTYLTRIQVKNAFGSIYGFRYKGVYQYSEYSEVEIPGISGPNAPVVRNDEGRVIMEDGEPKPMYFSYGTTAAYEFQGGDAIYEDINNDGNINELDIVYLGSSLPLLNGGFGFRLNYGRLSVNTQFNFRYGNKIVNRARMNAEKMYDNTNQSASVNWRWRMDGDITTIPRALYQSGYNWLGSDRFVEDGSFLRCNYVQLSYQIPAQQLKPLGINQLSFYVSMNNLFILTRYSGVDPELGYGGYSITFDDSQTPRAKSFTAGITLSF
jgi:TonB-linked SusC/RagA family outer membrane protein